MVTVAAKVLIIVFMIYILQLISPSLLQGILSHFFNNWSFKSFKYLFGDFVYEYNVFLSQPPSQLLWDMPPSHPHLHVFFFLVKIFITYIVLPIYGGAGGVRECQPAPGPQH